LARRGENRREEPRRPEIRGKTKPGEKRNWKREGERSGKGGAGKEEWRGWQRREEKRGERREEDGSEMARGGKEKSGRAQRRREGEGMRGGAND